MPPLPDSPVVDAGSDAAVAAPYSFATDQRGVPRLSGQHVDIGAVELQTTSPVPPTIAVLGAVVTGTNAANGTLTVHLSVSVKPSVEAASAVSFPYGLTPAYGGLGGPVAIGAAFLPLPTYTTGVDIGLAPGATYHWKATVANGVAVAATSDQTLRLAAGGIPGDTDGNGTVDQNEFNAVLAAYYPTSPWLRMTNVAGLGGTNVTFALPDAGAVGFGVEYSTNLVDWLPLGPAVPRYEFVDTNAPVIPQRHYRLRLP
jgi:hypothetical protein